MCFHNYEHLNIAPSLDIKSLLIFFRCTDSAASSLSEKICEITREH